MKKVKEILYILIKKILPEIWFHKLWAWYSNKNSKYDRFDRYKSEYILSSQIGKKQYFIIRYSAPWSGVLASATKALFYCEWAEKNRMVPIIDYEYKYVYVDYLLGVNNMWEYVFKNPLSVKEGVKKRNVFVSELNFGQYIMPSMEKEWKFLQESGENFTRSDWRTYCKKLKNYSNKWLILQDNVLERYTQIFSNLFQPEMKILGICMREEFSMKNEEIQGTDLETHPHHMDLTEMMGVIKEYYAKWNCTHIYVTTYMQDTIDCLQNEFGDALLFTNRRRVPFEKFREARQVVEYYLEKSGIWDKNKDDAERMLYEEKSKELFEWYNSDDELAKIMNTYSKDSIVEYIEEIYGLSLCNCLLASGKSSGAYVACIWNEGKYAELEILPDRS